MLQYKSRKRVKSLLLYLFLLQLPFTAWPTCTGIIHGFLFVQFMDDLDDQAAWNWKLDQEKDYAILPWLMNVPREPYHIPKLRSTQWTRQLGLMRPKHISSVTSLGALDSLLSMQPTRVQWVYLSDNSASPFDAAFDKLIQHHYVYPPRNNAAFFHADPNIAPFLNSVWRIKPPALLQLGVEEPYGKDQEDFIHPQQRTPPHFSHSQHPITVRIAELPVSFPLVVSAASHFPTPFSQLLSLTSGTVDPSALPSWNFMHQSIHRFNAHYTALVLNLPALGTVDSIDNWLDVHTPVLNSGTVHHVVVQVASVAAVLPLAMHYSVLVPAWRWFTGQDDLDGAMEAMEPVLLGNMDGGKWTGYPLLQEDFAKMVKERMEKVEDG